MNGRLRRKLPANVLREPLARVRRWEVRALRKGKVCKEALPEILPPERLPEPGDMELFNLGGRSIGEGGLPRPVYNVQDEGKVVVTITVNPAGQVIATSINRQTNTVNPALRKAAEDAAKKARFNTVSGLNNQTGTITYYFNLK